MVTRENFKKNVNEPIPVYEGDITLRIKWNCSYKMHFKEYLLENKLYYYRVKHLFKKNESENEDLYLVQIINYLIKEKNNGNSNEIKDSDILFDLNLKNEEDINLEGKVTLDWLPDPRLEFEGCFSSEFSFLVSCIERINPCVEIYINDDSYSLSGSRAKIIGPINKDELVISVKGSLERIVPEKDEKLNRLEFSITNFTYEYPCAFPLFDKTEIVIKPINKMEIYFNEDSSNLSGFRANRIGRHISKSESVIFVKGSLEEIVPEKDKKVNRLEFSITNFTYEYPCAFPLFDKTEIVIKPRNTIKELISELDKKVGRCITHHGVVEFKQGISFDESEKILDSLHYSLSFLSANHVGIVFLKYYFDSEDNPKTVYIHSKPYRNYQNVFRGLIGTKNNIGILNGTRFVANMYEAYKRDEKDAGSILLLVTYYIDSNANNLVTSFILTVACIELLCGALPTCLDVIL